MRYACEFVPLTELQKLHNSCRFFKMVATPLRLGNDVIDCHISEREMGLTPVA